MHIKKSFSTVIIVLLSIIVLSIPISAESPAYTRYSTVSNGQATLYGGPTGYWILYSTTSNSYNYQYDIDSAVKSWNSTSGQTTFNFNYTTTDNSSAYSSSKLRFVVADYGSGVVYRGATYFYNSLGSEIGSEVDGPDRNWYYCIIRINNTKITEDNIKYGSEPNYSWSKGVRSTAAHEIGHALGLGHHDTHNVLMNALCHSDSMRTISIRQPQEISPVSLQPLVRPLKARPLNLIH